MSQRQPSLPLLWLLSDARNDARLEAALAALPRGSGFVFRHYHLAKDERRARFGHLAAAARGFGHVVILADNWLLAEAWSADGVYGSVPAVAETPRGIRLATAHDADELVAADRAGANGVFVSPVFATRSHPLAPTLGIHGFHILAQQAPARLPVIALGGMTHARAAELGWPRWGAIDGLGDGPG